MNGSDNPDKKVTLNISISLFIRYGYFIALSRQCTPASFINRNKVTMQNAFCVAYALGQSGKN
jgi:hypothetical protein